MSPEEKVRRLLRAALRRPAAPYEVRLALMEWARIEVEEREAEIAEMAAHYGAELAS
jgi:hypothetical protein